MEVKFIDLAQDVSDSSAPQCILCATKCPDFMAFDVDLEQVDRIDMQLVKDFIQLANRN